MKCTHETHMKVDKVTGKSPLRVVITTRNLAKPCFQSGGDSAIIHDGCLYSVRLRRTDKFTERLQNQCHET